MIRHSYVFLFFNRNIHYCLFNLHAASAVKSLPTKKTQQITFESMAWIVPEYNQIHAHVQENLV